MGALNTVTKLLDDGKDINACSLNYSKTFNVINHRYLCAKLTTLRVPTQVGLGTIELTASVRCASEIWSPKKL